MHVGEVQIDGGNRSQRFISRTEGSLPVLKGWSVVNSLFLWIFMSSQLNWISRIGPAFFTGLSMEHNLSSSRPSIVRKIDDLMNIVRTL